MGMNARCFLLDDTGKHENYLRRYVSVSGIPCPLSPGKYSYHQARAFLTVTKSETTVQLVERSSELWPKVCGCGYEFKLTDEWQVFHDRIYVRRDTSEEMTLTKAPPGAMWFADWMVRGEDQNWWRGPDGHCLMVRGFYGQDFCPDQRASNCTLPTDDKHKCWVRVGEVPNINIGKVGGPTCGAGAGSFYFGPNREWHGFLESGELVQR